MERAVKAGEGGDAEGGFEDVVEFVDKVWVGGIIGYIGDECDETCVCGNESLECGPGGHGARGRGRSIAVLVDAGRDEISSEYRSLLVVRVDKKERHNLVWICIHPCLDIVQKRLQRASVQQTARCVAELQSSILIVHLCL